jgi:two-component system alkaline phosphatase synthesis response regulator PhoP
VTAPESVVRFGDNEFDFHSLRGRSWDGADQVLTRKEALILKLLVERADEVVRRDEIMDRVWGDEDRPATQAIDAFIDRLRARFEPDPERPRHFHSVHGIGYRFTVDRPATSG